MFDPHCLETHATLDLECCALLEKSSRRCIPARRDDKVGTAVKSLFDTRFSALCSCRMLSVTCSYTGALSPDQEARNGRKEPWGECVQQAAAGGVAQTWHATPRDFHFQQGTLQAGNQTRAHISSRLARLLLIRIHPAWLYVGASKQRLLMPSSSLTCEYKIETSSTTHDDFRRGTIQAHRQQELEVYRLVYLPQRYIWQSSPEYASHTRPAYDRRP
jgi:hypothetical protein